VAGRCPTGYVDNTIVGLSDLERLHQQQQRQQAKQGIVNTAVPPSTTDHSDIAVHVLCLHRTAYTRLLQADQGGTLAAKVRFLHGMHLFHNWPQRLVAQLALSLKVHRVPRQQYLYRTGDAAGSIFIVRTGSLVETQTVEYSTALTRNHAANAVSAVHRRLRLQLGTVKPHHATVRTTSSQQHARVQLSRQQGTPSKGKHKRARKRKDRHAEFHEEEGRTGNSGTGSGTSESTIADLGRREMRRVVEACFAVQHGRDAMPRDLAVAKPDGKRIVQHARRVCVELMLSGPCSVVGEQPLLRNLRSHRSDVRADNDTLVFELPVRRSQGARFLFFLFVVVVVLC